ncbi:hypothetical protein Tco_1204293 [Tanacetum coccineum]
MELTRRWLPTVGEQLSAVLKTAKQPSAHKESGKELRNILLLAIPEGTREKILIGDKGRGMLTTNEPIITSTGGSRWLEAMHWSNDFDEPVNYALTTISSSSSSSSSDNEVEIARCHWVFKPVH